MDNRFRRTGIFRLQILLVALGISIAPAHAAELAQASGKTLAIGVLAHDSGPFSDHHEGGMDLNLEAQFSPLNFLGSPRPHLGASINFQGDTNVAYAGLSFRLRETKQWFADGILGVALHDGPLHKDPVGCQQYSDCGYGTRVLPRFGLEIGYRVSPVASISLLFDHMSHKWLVAGENEGLDHVGLRYLRSY